MLGTNWRPSAIEDKIYDMMEGHEAGVEVYEEALTDLISDYLTKNFPGMEWNLGCSPWPNMDGGVCFICWIEEGHLHSIVFDYVKKGHNIYG